MNISTQDEQRSPRAGARGRPLTFLIAAILGLGALGVLTGAALGSVGSGSSAPASVGHDCPGRGGYGGGGFGGGGFGGE